MRDGEAPATLRPVQIWDLPTRIFHWSIVLLVAFSWFSNRQNWMQLHFISGYTILGMLLFRILWGFVGAETSRFRQFLKSPIEALRHLRHLFVREPDREVGHNAAGGWMVVGLLVLMLVQVGSGLGSHDDVSTEGPLVKHISQSLSDRLSSLHSYNFTMIELAVLVHVCAVLAYLVLKRQNLLGPMITGVKRLPQSIRAPRMASRWVTVAVMTSAATVAALVATRL